MTIFQRPEKPGEADSGAKPAPREVTTETRTPAASPPVPAPPPARPQVAALPQASHPPATSVISKALKITGQLESSEDIQIEGQIDGDVRGVNVKVGQNAKVKGTVYGDQVELAGTVEGKIEAKKVVLASTAHMSGDVVHQDIRIESGAFIDGHCKPEYGKTPAAKSANGVRTAAE
ncbi:MAG: polymer-forming cytoskeletal protein [Rhizomicrobium sp.]|jgi:cytoskeletal protein CcmA (bactofilin family)